MGKVQMKRNSEVVTLYVFLVNTKSENKFVSGKNEIFGN